MNNYFNRLTETLHRHQETMQAFAIQLARILEQAWSESASVYVMGNGGSDSTSQHMVIDFMSIRHQLKHPIKIEALTSNSSVLTAIANDIDFKYIFSRQLEVKLTETDICIFISASGGSINLLNACVVAKEIGAKTIALLGFDGGKLISEVDEYFLVETPYNEYGIVEDLHLSLVHATAEKLRQNY